MVLAWALCLASDPMRLDQSPQYQHNWARWRWQEELGFGASRVKVDPIADDVYYLPGAHALSVVHELPTYQDDVKLLPRRRPPLWSATRGFRTPPAIRDVPVIYWREEAYGWPFPCLRQQWLLPSKSSQLELHGGLDLAYGPRLLGSATGAEKGLPLTLLWLGLCADVVVFSLATLLLSIGAALVKKQVRLHRDRCPSCAYCLHGSQRCPECGWQWESRER